MYKVTTNNHLRPIVEASQLPADKRSDFDYLDWSAIERGDESATFVQYRGEWHDLGDVMLAPDSIKALGFDGFNSDSFFSGIAFRYFDADGNLLDGGDSIIVATIFAD